ncbi:di-heme oxidoredictase family protein [Zavarzinia compransoris]|uniref:di-heme oxidoreductase family protein n=1 Tax=Zavarzinia compransoris TaxID=1264899 RepID=UPI001FB82E60|nr:di-heme oxidoredictase family protein [Zavarzinia compransoris]
MIGFGRLPRPFGLAVLLAVAALILAARPPFARALFEPGEERPGGAATALKARDSRAFTHPSAGMSLDRRLDFGLGDALFRKRWASSPSSTTASDGLGPLFNARACESCHRRDGRGQVPDPGAPAVSLVLRLGLPGGGAEPTYGHQLQNAAIQGFRPEGRLTLAYDEVPVALAGGEVASLRRPAYGVADLAQGPLAPDVQVSARIAPPMIGLGLLEAIPAADIVARADPDDADGDGISGRAQRLGPEARLGRFGWKAAQPDIAAQAADAFATDIGLSTPLIRRSRGDCTERQPACLAAPAGDDPAEGVEVTARMFDLTVFYARHLAVPARPAARDPEVLAGKALFLAAGCSACHVPAWVTGRDGVDPELAGQRIYPYTDLLLHDMGPGLADGKAEGEAAGAEWRTPPLWGIGLTAEVGGRTEFLHDGRARNLIEAILWHGGEAERARDAVIALSPAERARLITFLQSL